MRTLVTLAVAKSNGGISGHTVGNFFSVLAMIAGGLLIAYLTSGNKVALKRSYKPLATLAVALLFGGFVSLQLIK